MAGNEKSSSITNYEKLGALYLGKRYDLKKAETTDEFILYDANDLTTHAVCVGMTGSGKTGLCIGLLEEALIDGVPAIAVDLKGDLANLMLTFPNLSPADFLPWIDPDQASREGKSSEQVAEATANLWRKGLGEWGQDGSRISRLRKSADFAVYTPGGSAGMPIALLRSFAAPSRQLIDDRDAFRDAVMATTSSLLTLLKMDADPVRSREHILISNILTTSWQKGRDVDLGTLIHLIQKPPFDKIGVLDIDSFFPADDRFALAMTINNLLASPGFAAWMEGEPLDAQRLLWTAEGKPRLSILYIAHLSDPERMFFLTHLLNEVISWMRNQPGTGSLRALLYIDEVFGYFPPTANPPTKAPMLTLLKQARAYGLGVVLATQNPVDLDYKGLSNAGTWLLGRLQTEQDKQRVLDGLEGASAVAGSQFERKSIDKILSGLGKRVFLMNNVHEAEPFLFKTRWCMSYLRGPLTTSQIRSLMEGKLLTVSREAEKKATASSAGPVRVDAGRPVLEPGVEELFGIPPRALGAGEALVYRPAVLGEAKVHYVKASRDLDHWEEVAFLSIVDKQGTDPWPRSDQMRRDAVAFENEPEPGARFDRLPSEVVKAKQYKEWSAGLKRFIYQYRKLPLFHCEPLKQFSRPGESEGDFRVRLRQAVKEIRDAEVGKLRKKYSSKISSIQKKIHSTENVLAREKSQYSRQRMETAISFGETILDAFLGGGKGRRGTAGRISRTVSKAGKTAGERSDYKRAEKTLVKLKHEMASLEAEMNSEMDRIRNEFNPETIPLTGTEVAPRKSDITVDRVALVWLPSISES